MVKGEGYHVGKGADEEQNGVACRDVAGGRELVQQEAADDRENHPPIEPAALPRPIREATA